AEIATGARLVLDDHRLAERAAQFVGDHPRLRVGAAAGRERHDDAQRVRRPRLRERGLAPRRQGHEYEGERGGHAGKGHAVFHAVAAAHFIMRAAPLTTSAPATTRRNTTSLRPAWMRSPMKMPRSIIGSVTATVTSTSRLNSSIAK